MVSTLEIFSAVFAENYFVQVLIQTFGVSTLEIFSAVLAEYYLVRVLIQFSRNYIHR